MMLFPSLCSDFGGAVSVDAPCTTNSQGMVILPSFSRLMRAIEDERAGFPYTHTIPHPTTHTLETHTRTLPALTLPSIQAPHTQLLPSLIPSALLARGTWIDPADTSDGVLSPSSSSSPSSPLHHDPSWSLPSSPYDSSSLAPEPEATKAPIMFHYSPSSSPSGVDPPMQPLASSSDSIPPPPACSDPALVPPVQVEYFCGYCGREYAKCPHEQRCTSCSSRIRWRCFKCNTTVAASQKSSHETCSTHTSHAIRTHTARASSDGYYCCTHCSRTLAQMPHSCCCSVCNRRIRWHCNVCQAEVDATGKTPHKKSLKHRRNVAQQASGANTEKTTQDKGKAEDEQESTAGAGHEDLVQE
eukprot:TRINITY_DN1655_c0_g1_i6.p1 TRINITY_DN1655_c0_g1~~TRINITY_DN1655_c0_g1_i6.p1  ORF type:complete len:357 (-),score=71.55 TRINITY_DN1655_c0_g1_i6:56-1126(-)